MAEYEELQAEQNRLKTEIDRLSAALQTSSTTSTIGHVAIKIGPFWKKDPELWFKQLEAQFALARVTTDETKYHHVVGKVDAEILDCCSDLIQTPPATNKYAAIKSRIISEFTESKTNKMQQLLRSCELGDRKPSQLLREMKKLANGIVTDESLIKMLWMQKLPETSQAVLKVSEDLLTADQLAEQADKLGEISRGSNVAAVSTNNDPYAITELKKEIANITVEIAALKRKGWSPSQQTPSRSQGNVPNGNDPFCFFHRKFGAAARKCRQPCQFHTKNASNYTQ